MKAVLSLDDKLFIVAALTKKRLEKKVIKVIKEQIFDPYGDTYSYILIRGSNAVKSSVTLVDPELAILKYYEIESTKIVLCFLKP